MAGAAGAEPSSSLLIDDFEDGDTVAKKPFGVWYPTNDGSAPPGQVQGLGIEPAGVDASSVYALRTHGSGYQVWGAAVGVDLVQRSYSTGGAPTATPLNALAYAKVCFKARIESGATDSIQLHLLRGTDPARGPDHYTKQLSLSESWTPYCIPFVDLIRTDGTPLVADQLTALQFFFPPGSLFAFWLDDVELTP
jgi:hypothetical protein